MNTPKPVINITRTAPDGRPQKFARVTFPEGWTMAAIRTTLDRFPESEGYRCDLREVGPLGFSLPWTGEAVEVTPEWPRGVIRLGGPVDPRFMGAA